MSATSQMQGARLEFVVRSVKGKVKRPVHSWDPEAKKIVTEMKEQAGGYIVYTPFGQSYRLTNEEFLRRRFDRQPKILNFDRVNDTETPAGRYKHAMSDAARQAAWKDLEQEVIRLCVRRHGPIMTKEADNVEQAA